MAPTRSLDDLRISPEVAWYLESRGIPLPDCPPRFKSPEPRNVKGASFDPERVDKVLQAFGLLRHTQGAWAGKPLSPDPWQVAYILAPVFGWISGGVRIIRNVYIEVPRKNGKTTLAGGCATYLTGADGEQGAQVLAVATSLKQANFCFEPVKKLVAASPALRGHMQALAHKIVHTASGSTFEAVSSISEALHGANVHGAIIDELHIHKTADLVESVETGTGARTQPVVMIITTADDGRQASIYDRRRKLAEELDSGVITDPDVYAVVWCADKEDDPFDPATWAKANPGLGISPSVKSLESAALKAKNSPADLASFLRLHLNIRTKQDVRYLDLGAWDINASMVDEAALTGEKCYGMLDLAATSDLTALCWLFPDDHGGYDAIWRHWLPEDGFDQLNKRTHGQAEVWRRDGWLTVTDGAVADYDFVKSTIRHDADTFNVEQLGFDRWNASQLVNDLTGEGLPMVAVGQGFQSMSPGTKELQRLILSGTVDKPVFRHGGNPLVRWQVDNFAVVMDPAGNVKPAKDRAGDKIDGIVTACGALFITTTADVHKKSVYETRGAIAI